MKTLKFVYFGFLLKHGNDELNARLELLTYKYS